MAITKAITKTCVESGDSQLWLRSSGTTQTRWSPCIPSCLLNSGAVEVRGLVLWESPVTALLWGSGAGQPLEFSLGVGLLVI